MLVFPCRSNTNICGERQEAARLLSQTNQIRHDKSAVLARIGPSVSFLVVGVWAKLVIFAVQTFISTINVETGQEPASGELANGSF